LNNNTIFLGEHSLDLLTQPKEKIIASIGSCLSKYKPLNANFYRPFGRKFYKDSPHLLQGNTGKWSYSDVSINGEYGIHKTAFLIGGTFGFLFRVSAAFIEFLYPVYKINDWYSNDNQEEVTKWRMFFKQMVYLLGGTKALYITSTYFLKYHHFFVDPSRTFNEKLDDIIAKHGPIKKGFCDFANSKHPRYFIWGIAPLV
jgi:hypothetical protein